MDRLNKPLSGSGGAHIRRGPKGRASLSLPGDFIALGSKQRPGSSSHSDPTEPKPILRKPIIGAKRDTGSSSLHTTGSSLAKRPKLSSSSAYDVEKKSGALYESAALEIDPPELVEQITDASDSGDYERVEGLICGAVKHLRNNRTRPDSAVYTGLMLLAKTRPLIFGSETVIDAFCSLLKRDVTHSFKTKSTTLLQIFACNVLSFSFMDEETWPEAFVKIYVEDALADRSWVDSEDCRCFVNNVQTAFNTKVQSKTAQATATVTEALKSIETPGSSPVVTEDERSQDAPEISTSKSLSSLESCNMPITSRYHFIYDSVEMLVVDIIREQLTRRQGMDTVSRNVLKLLSSTAGYGEVRLLSSQRLEMWLQNPKLTRPAQDLLMAVCLNCNQHNQQDVEVISHLIKIRLKTKPLINHYMICFRELLSQHPENLNTILKHTIYNELSNARNPNNMGLLAVIFQHSSELAAKLLAQVFQDLLMNRDDYLRALRALLREIVRALRYDINFVVFCKSLMKEKIDIAFVELESALKDRFFASVVDLVCLCMLLGITPSVRDAASAHSRGDNRDIETLRNYQCMVSQVQSDGIQWMHSTVPKMFHPNQTDYVHSLHKLLFMESTETYYNKDNWPPENERGTLLRIASEVPLQEDTIMWVLLMGLSKDLPLNPADALELADLLVKRAASLWAEDFVVLKVTRIEIITMIFNLCAYRHPENITLPAGYTPPTLAIATLYWKAWLLLLVITAFNPSEFGSTAWNDYPMLRCFMENIMTNQFSYPSAAMLSKEDIDVIRNKELQMVQYEKHRILEFESHLAKASTSQTITETNSLLLSQLITMDPTGPSRKPTKEVYEQLQKLNKTLKIGHLLCRSRKPDFLLEIIQQQGTSKSMPWLVELVQSSESSLDVLPVQCLCEFVLHDDDEADDADNVQSDKGKKEKKELKQKQLLARLQSMLWSPTSATHTVSEILGYFLFRLSSSVTITRQLANKGLSMVMARPRSSTADADDEEDANGEAAVEDDDSAMCKWLLIQVQDIPAFHDVKREILEHLCKACQVETNPTAVSAYIQFIAKHIGSIDLQNMADISLTLAQLVVERPIIANYVLPSESCKLDSVHKTLASMLTIFNVYINKAREPSKEAYSWSESLDQIHVQWSTGEAAVLHIQVTQAVMALLSYGPPKGTSCFQELLDIWFTPEGDAPSAYLVDTSEEAFLLPDWLRLHMIRSRVPRLVTAALKDAEPDQLVLFFQSFGIPVMSMDKLLAALDHSTEENAEAILDATANNRDNMANLVELQWARGATAGQKFHKCMLDTCETDDEMTSPEPAVSESAAREEVISQPVVQTSAVLTAGDLERTKNTIVKVFDKNTTSAESHSLLRLLLRSVTHDVHSKSLELTEEISTVFVHLLDEETSQQFLDTLHDKTSLSAPLFVLLRNILKRNEMTAKLPQLSTLMQSLSCRSQKKSTPLSRILNQVQNGEQETKPSDVGKWEDSLLLRYKSIINGSSERLASDCAASSSSQLSLSSAPSMVKPIVCALMGSHKSSGYLVDWLTMIDPEIINLLPEEQCKLLFSKKGAAEETSVPSQSSLHPYLLALVTHQGRWETLRECINLVCRPEENDYNPSTVLDFLWACMHVPKIWQGYDKKIPKKCVKENALGLTFEQVIRVVEYILSTAGTDLASVNKHVELLLLCCHDNRDLLNRVSAHLCEIIRKKTSSLQAAQKLLMLLYVNVPHILSTKDVVSNLAIETADEDTITKLDSVTHRMLSNLGNVQMESEMHDANVKCRKLAATHPRVLLRQLPLISAILKGRTRLNYKEFKQKEHMTVFTNVLGLLELLQPDIFNCDASLLGDVLESYFELLENYALDETSHELATVVKRFCQFVHQYLAEASSDNLTIQSLRKHNDLLQMLLNMYPDLSSLRSLVAGVSTSGGSTASDTSQGRPSSPWSMSQLQPLRYKLMNAETPADLNEVLRTLDDISSKKVDILQHFTGELQMLLVAPSETVRDLAHDLLIRHITHIPRSSVDFISSYLDCLDSGNQDIIQSVLKKLPELALLCQEHTPKLLGKCFDIAMELKMDTSSYISQTLRTLNE